jgi:hypothetical protein
MAVDLTHSVSDNFADRSVNGGAIARFATWRSFTWSRRGVQRGGVALCGRALWITAFDLNEIDPEKVAAAERSHGILASAHTQGFASEREI